MSRQRAQPWPEPDAVLDAMAKAYAPATVAIRSAAAQWRARKRAELIVTRLRKLGFVVMPAAALREIEAKSELRRKAFLQEP